jgi:hypothetical protein
MAKEGETVGPQPAHAAGPSLLARTPASLTFKNRYALFRQKRQRGSLGWAEGQASSLTLVSPFAQGQLLRLPLPARPPGAATLAPAPASASAGRQGSQSRGPEARRHPPHPSARTLASDERRQPGAAAITSLSYAPGVRLPLPTHRRTGSRQEEAAAVTPRPPSGRAGLRQGVRKSRGQLPAAPLM